MKREAAGAKKAGQSIGGQFAAVKKSQASGVGLGEHGYDSELDRILEQRTAQLNRLTELTRAMEEEEAHIAREMLSARVEMMFGDDRPEINRVVFHYSDDVLESLRFNSLMRPDGTYVALSEAQQEELSDFVDSVGFSSRTTLIDDPATIENHDPNHPVMTLVEPALPSGSEECRFIDTNDGPSLNRAINDAMDDGRIVSANIRTRAQFEDELRMHLADTVNEQLDGARENYIDDGNIDAWVDEAIERYEDNRPDELDDALAFRDAIDAARPHDH